MVIEKQIAKYLFKTLKDSWANENVKMTKPFPELKLLNSKSGDWRYVDQYVGGEPYQGFEVIWFKNKPIWSMTYRGLYHGSEPYKKFITFLKAALSAAPKEMPVRGPKKFAQKQFANWSYENSWRGKMNEFKGREEVFFKKKIVFWTDYQGGTVNHEFENL